MQTVRRLFRRHWVVAAVVVVAVMLAVVAELALANVRPAPSARAAEATKQAVLRDIGGRLAAEPVPEKRGCKALQAMTLTDAAAMHDDLRGVVAALAGATDPRAVAMRNFIDLMSGGPTPALEAAAASTPSKEYGPYTVWGDITRDFCKDLEIPVS